MKDAKAKWLAAPQQVALLRALDGSVRVSVRDIEIMSIAAAPPGLADALHRWFAGELDIAAISVSNLAVIQYLTSVLQKLKAIEYRIHLEHSELTFIPNLAEWSPPILEKAACCRLSPFAFLKPGSSCFTLECPDAEGKILLPLRWAPLLAGLSDVFDESKLDVHHRELAFVLGQTGFLVGENQSAAHMSWEFHDRLFHQASRGGKSAANLGATYRFAKSFPAPDAIKLPMSCDPIVVEANSSEETQALLDLRNILFNRRSSRKFGNRPLSVTQLRRLLCEAVSNTKSQIGEHETLLFRPYPSGGAIHELEFYAIVARCDGLERGMYHFHTQTQNFHRLEVDAAHFDALVRKAQQTLPEPQNILQVLIVISSRLPRLSWKYEGIAYRITLLNAGAAIQTLYLVASALNLNCTALGLGDSELFSRATGLDTFEEVSVAEFVVGTSPDVPD